MEDKTLLANIIKGDHDTFRTLMERYYGALFVFASRVMQDDFIAKDIVQDTFTHIWHERRKLTENISIKNYLYGIVRNKCMLVIRSSQVSEKYINAQKNIEEDLVSKYIETETIRLLLEAIETLPPRSAEVIRLSLDGVRQEDIAAQMGIAVVTVKALKAEGIRKLRKLLPLGLLIPLL